MKVVMRDFVSLDSDETRDVTVDLAHGVLYLKVDGVTCFAIRGGYSEEGDAIIRYWSKEDKSSFKHEVP